MVCDCEIYETCNQCRGTDGDVTMAAKRANERGHKKRAPRATSTDSDIDILSQRMTRLEDRLDRLEDLLSRIGKLQVELCLDEARALREQAEALRDQIN